MGNFSIKSSYSSQYCIKKAYKMFKQNNLIGFSTLSIQFTCQNYLSVNIKNVSYRKTTIPHYIIFYTLATEFPHAKSPKLPDLADAVILPSPTPQQSSKLASKPLRHSRITNHLSHSQHFAC